MPGDLRDEILQILLQNQAAPTPAPAPPERLVPLPYSAGPTPAAAPQPGAPAAPGFTLDDVRAAVRQEMGLATSYRRGAGITNVPAPSGMAAGEVRDPYALTKDDVAAMVRQHGATKAYAKLKDALFSAPSKRLKLNR
jgi:hypothetical protein